MDILFLKNKKSGLGIEPATFFKDQPTLVPVELSQ